MRVLWPWLVVGGVALGIFGLVVTQRPRWSFGGAPLRPGVDRDPGNLLPEFADKLELVFRAMRRRGFEPLLWEGLRSPERAQEMEDNDLGRANSLHIYGAAADVVDEATAPDYWEGVPGFWDALGEETEAAGLTWGGHFSNHDVVHLQLVPFRDEVAFRASHDVLRPQPA